MAGLATAEDESAADGPARRVKRPMNSFLLFSNEMRPILQAKHRDSNNAQISKMLGAQWKALTVAQKQAYVDAAEKLKVDFRAAHPDYIYTKTPRKHKKRKVSSERQYMDGTQGQEFLAYIPPPQASTRTTSSSATKQFALFVPLPPPSDTPLLHIQELPTAPPKVSFSPQLLPPHPLDNIMAYAAFYHDPRSMPDFSSVL